MKGKKCRGSSSVLAEPRELAATDGVVANGLNLNQPRDQPPRERTIPVLDATPTSREKDRQGCVSV